MDYALFLLNISSTKVDITNYFPYIVHRCKLVIAILDDHFSYKFHSRFSALKTHKNYTNLFMVNRYSNPYLLLKNLSITCKILTINKFESLIRYPMHQF